MAWTDWRRWIATLCVVLVAFVMAEQSLSSDPCHGAAPVSYNIAELASFTDSSDAQPGSPTPAQSQHHCCAAHSVAMPPLHHASTIDQVVIRMDTPLDDGRAPHGEQGGQDRPPRVSALV